MPRKTLAQLRPLVSASASATEHFVSRAQQPVQPAPPAPRGGSRTEAALPAPATRLSSSSAAVTAATAPPIGRMLETLTDTALEDLLGRLHPREQ